MCCTYIKQKQKEQNMLRLPVFLDIFYPHLSSANRIATSHRSQKGSRLQTLFYVIYSTNMATPAQTVRNPIAPLLLSLSFKKIRARIADIIMLDFTIGITAIATPK